MSAPVYNLPYDRIKVTYVSDHSVNQEETELPFKLLMLGDYKGIEDTDSISDRKAISINKNTFAEVMSAFNVTLQQNVDDKLSDARENMTPTLPIDIKFDSLRDFHPDAFSKQVPELAKLIKFRELLTKAKTEPKNIQQTVKEIEQLLLSPAPSKKS